MSDPTLKEALAAAGYQAERINWPTGEIRGMRILKDGQPVHDTAFASAEFGWELLGNLAAPIN